MRSRSFSRKRSRLRNTSGGRGFIFSRSASQTAHSLRIGFSRDYQSDSIGFLSSPFGGGKPDETEIQGCRTMKRKWIATIVAVACMSVAALTSCDVGLRHKDYEDTVTSSEYFEFTLVGEEYEISAKADMVLPETVNLPTVYEGKPVTAIGDEGFSAVTILKNLTVPDSYKKIGTAAFKGATDLKKVEVLGSSLQEVGAFAFQNCEKLSDYTFNDGLTAIGQFAFAKTAVYKFTPANVETIGKYAFYGCSSLKTVKIPASLTVLGESAFTGCTFTSVSVDAGNTHFTVVDNQIVAK